MSVQTVNRHKYNIMGKLGCRKRSAVELAHWALHEGIVENLFAEGREVR